MQIGLIGFGNFGKFIYDHLKLHFTVKVFDKKKDTSSKISFTSFQEVLLSDIIILCVPVQHLEELLGLIKKYKINKDTLFIDVSSVKKKPVQLMKNMLPSDVQILGTHPLFGPQSGKFGIKGLRVVLCPIRINDDYMKKIENFFINKLKLVTINMKPERHDFEMAYVQGLTHFVGRALNQMNIPDTENKTKAFDSLLNVKDMLKYDSYELFLTLEKENSFTKSVREKFLKELNNINNKIL